MTQTLSLPSTDSAHGVAIPLPVIGEKDAWVPSGSKTDASFFERMLDFQENEHFKETVSSIGSILPAITAAAQFYKGVQTQSALNFISSFAAPGVNPFGSPVLEGYLSNGEMAQKVSEVSESLDGLGNAVTGEGIPSAVTSASGASASLTGLLLGVIADEGYSLHKELQDYRNGNCITEVELFENLLQ